MPSKQKAKRRRTDPWVSVLTAARMLSISPQTVYSLAARAELESQIVAGRTFLHRSSIAQYNARREQASA